MAKIVLEDWMSQAEEIRGADLSYDSTKAVQLRMIYNNFSGERETCCLCTKGKRLRFKQKFFNWYDYR